MTTKIAIQVKSGPSGEPWWDEVSVEYGQGEKLRGREQKPNFNGDIQKYGQDLIDWFNRGEPEGQGTRIFIKAEKRNMSVGELIQYLGQFDSELEIMASDANGESGDEAIQFLKPRLGKLEDGTNWGEGKHSMGRLAVDLPFFK